GDDNRDIIIPPSGEIARIVLDDDTIEAVAGIPVPVIRRNGRGRVVGLPEPQINRIYIVSGMVADHVRASHWQRNVSLYNGPSTGRADVFAPATGPNDGAISNAEGQIVAVTRLVIAQ